MQLKNKKPKVRQILFRLDIGHYIKSVSLIKVKVVKVGKKFFYCSTGNSPQTRQYKISTWHETYIYGSSDSRLFESEQAYEDEKETNSICSFLSKNFQYGENGLDTSLVNLRKIKKLLYLKGKKP